MSFCEGEWRKFCPHHINSRTPSVNKIIFFDTNLITWLKSPFIVSLLCSYFLSLFCTAMGKEVIKLCLHTRREELSIMGEDAEST